MIYNLIVGSTTTLEDLNRELRYTKLIFDYGEIWSEGVIETRWENKTLIITSRLEIPNPVQAKGIKAVEFYSDKTSAFLSRIYINPSLKIQNVATYVLITKISDVREVKVDLYPLFSGLNFDKNLIRDKRSSPFRTLTIGEAKNRFTLFSHQSSVTNNDLDVAFQVNSPTKYTGYQLMNNSMIAEYKPYPRHIIAEKGSKVEYDMVTQKVYSIKEEPGKISLTIGEWDDAWCVDVSPNVSTVTVNVDNERDLRTSRFYTNRGEFYSYDGKLIGMKSSEAGVSYVLNDSELLSFKDNVLFNCSLSPLYEQLDRRIIKHQLGKDYKLVDIKNNFFIFADRTNSNRLIINYFNNYRRFTKVEYDNLTFLNQGIILSINEDMVDFFDIDEPSFDKMGILEKRILIDKMGYSDPFNLNLSEDPAAQVIKNPIVVGHRLYIQTEELSNNKLKFELL